MTPDIDQSMDAKGEYVSWMASFTTGENSVPVHKQSAGVQYTVALYWSFMTLSTIGYGDVTPQTPAEIWVACFAMVLGSSLYAYCVGAVCGTIANMDEAKQAYNRYSDSLTIFCDEQHIPRALTTRLREFFRQSQVVQSQKFHRQLLSVMSPGLVAEVAYRISGPMLLKLPFFNPENAPKSEIYDFVTSVTLKMEPVLFAAQETVIKIGMRMKGMYMVETGIAMGELNAMRLYLVCTF
jgi:hypothetical protein